MICCFQSLLDRYRYIRISTKHTTNKHNINNILVVHSLSNNGQLMRMLRTGDHMRQQALVRYMTL